MIGDNALLISVVQAIFAPDPVPIEALAILWCGNDDWTDDDKVQMIAQLRGDSKQPRRSKQPKQPQRTGSEG